MSDNNQDVMEVLNSKINLDVGGPYLHMDDDTTHEELAEWALFHYEIAQRDDNEVVAALTYALHRYALDYEELLPIYSEAPRWCNVVLNPFITERFPHYYQHNTIFGDRPKAAEPAWFVDGLIPEKGVGMLYGESGSFKSFFCTSLVGAMSRSPYHFLGLRIKQTSGRVMYLCGEGNGGVVARLKAEGVQPVDVMINSNKIDVGGSLPELRGIAASFKPDLIIYDTLNSLGFNVDNNSSKSVAGVFKQIQSIYERCPHLVVHHANKQGDSMEGSHVFRSNADFVLKTELVDHDDLELVDIVSVKQKDAGRLKPIRVEMKPINGSLTMRLHSMVERERASERSREALTDRQRDLYKLACRDGGVSRAECLDSGWTESSFKTDKNAVIGQGLIEKRGVSNQCSHYIAIGK